MARLYTFAKWTAVPLGLTVMLFLMFFGIDRIFLAPVCPPCHTEETRKLPDFERSMSSGLVNIQVAGRKFRSRIAGFENKTREGVILLHGYPETSIMWTPLQESLARRGYRTVAFDQRGYSPGARPGSERAYSIVHLVDDVIGIADAVGFKTFHIIGHDWGGLVAWNATDRYSGRVISLSVLSTPHPEALREGLFVSLDQLKSSSYALLNFIPGLSELILGFNRAALLKRNSWAMMNEQLRSEYEQVFTEPGALTAVLNWYRANSFFFAAPVGKIQPPTLFIWGRGDAALSRTAAEKTADYVVGPFRFVDADANHQLMSEIPRKVVQQVTAHIGNWPAKTLDSRPTMRPRTANGQTCDTSKPACLRINVSPSLQRLQIINKCDDRYRGEIIMRCTGWGRGKYVRHEFDVGPGGRFRYSTSGFKAAGCYYNQELCEVERR